MEKIVAGVQRFQSDVFPGQQALFGELATGQSPEVLFITCADSRIDPNLITQTDPGDLFVCRNAGNVVPPHASAAEGMTASIEFAVAALGVEHIVVCGHSDCGAMKGALNPDALDALPDVKAWLGHCCGAAAVVKEKTGSLGADKLADITRENVVLQMQHLRTHPAVAARVATGKVKLHGWVYDIETGHIHAYDEASDSFVDLHELHATPLEEVASAAR